MRSSQYLDAPATARELFPGATDGRTDGGGGNHATGEALSGPRAAEIRHHKALAADGEAGPELATRDTPRGGIRRFRGVFAGLVHY